jgi:uncharacterized protein (DUF427 family)
MGLMTGNGPLGRDPAGRFNFEPPPPGEALYVEPSPKRVRVVLGGVTVADSRAVVMVHESGHQPVYYFPREDVRGDLLLRSDRHTRCPKKGEARYHTVRAGDSLVENGAWYYPDPLPGAEGLRDMIAFYWDQMEAWYEEAEEVFVHPRDPYHRIDVRRSSRHVRISLDGQLLAESREPVALFESNLPTRWYLSRDDVVARLEPSQTTTACPYKGVASYYSVVLEGGEGSDRGEGGDGSHGVEGGDGSDGGEAGDGSDGVEGSGGSEGGRFARDLVWHYPSPLPEVAAIARLLCFFNERVDIELDGEAQERPESPWSHGVKSQNLPASVTRG